MTASYTLSMKTAISIPDRLFAQTDRLARRLKKSRSALYQEALQHYLRQFSEQDITERMNRVVDEVGDSEARRLVQRAGHRTPSNVEW